MLPVYVSHGPPGEKRSANSPNTPSEPVSHFCCQGWPEHYLVQAVGREPRVSSSRGVFSLERRVLAQVSNIEISNVSIGEVSILNISSLEAGGSQNRIGENGTLQRAPFERGPVHDGISEVRSIEVRVPQVPLRELGLLKLRVRHVCLRHDHTAQVELVPVHSREAALPQIVKLVAGGVGLSHLGRVEDAAGLIGVVDGRELELLRLTVGVGGDCTGDNLGHLSEKTGQSRLVLR